MGGIQNRLDKLMPYVKGMRFVKNTAVVDVQLKENWTIVKSDKILYQKGKNEENYFMFFSEGGSSTFDDILDFVEKTINFNIENEKKLELIKVKIEELKRHFETKSLDVLRTLKFGFDEITSQINLNPSSTEEKIEEEVYEEKETH
jgi:hypothetical protein